MNLISHNSTGSRVSYAQEELSKPANALTEIALHSKTIAALELIPFAADSNSRGKFTSFGVTAQE